MLNIDSNEILIVKKELHLIINLIESGFKEFIVSNDAKIKNVKMEIELKTGLIANEQVLCYQGEILEDEKGLSEYEIIDYSVIDIIGRLRGGMRIFVEMPNENIFTFLVENFEKIIDLKLKIEKLIGIKINKQILSYENKLLDDAKSLAQYKIVDKSLINIKKGIEIIVKSIKGKCETIYVQNSDKISDIYEKLAINPNKHKLIYQGKILEYFSTVENYQICDKLKIDIYDKDGMEIFARTMDGKTVAIEIQKSDKISDIKLKIQEKIGLHPDGQKLVYQGDILWEDKTIEDYQIEEKSVINVVDKLRGGMQIFAKRMDGKTVAYEIQKSDKIRDIKRKIQEKIGFHPDEQKLVYQGGILEEDKTIEDYLIKEKSVINIIARLRGAIFIYAKTMDGKTVPFEIQKSDKIRDIKIKIQDKIGLHPDKQKLVYKGDILEEDKTIEDYQIAENSVINIYDNQKTITINAKVTDDQTVKLITNINNKISNVKMRLYKKINFHPFKQILYYDNKILEDEKTICEYLTVGKGQIIKSYLGKIFMKKNLRDKFMYIMVKLKTDIMEIFITTMNGMKYELYAKENTKISDFKIEIQRILNVNANEQKLFYNGLLLDDDNKTMDDYQISEGSEINVKYQLQGWMQIFLQMSTGEKFELSIRKSDEIGDIKLDIQEKTRIYKSAQNLIYNNTILSDENKSVDEYQIEDESVINVKFKDQNILQCKIDEFDIADIKRLIHERLQFDCQLQKLIIYSKQLKDNKLFYEFFIMDKSEFSNYSNFQIFNSFIKSIKEGSLTDVQKYYTKCFLEMKHGLYLRSPLLYACKFGREEIVKYFIENKCNLESFDFELRRALHYAVISNNNKIIKLLMANNVDINASDSCGRRPIHLACEMNNIEAAQLLIQNNCDINSLDELNQSPLEISEKGRFDTLINLLKEYQMILKIAHEMQLKCDEGCDHKLCSQSFQCKNFVKGKVLGTGGFGKVYLCSESLTGRNFAVKKIPKDPTQSKYIEANINKFRDLICHERIIKYFGGYQRKENFLIFMEYLEKGSLDRIIKDTDISILNILKYTKQLLEALVFLHEHDIIHRDIKPENILLDINENLKLSDFGCSLLLSSVNNEIQKAVTFCGTSYYIAPEILNNEPYSCSADIWSLGVTVIEISTGKPPPKVTLYKVMETRKMEYELQDKIPKFIKDLIDKMHEPDQSNRASASILLEIVQSYFIENYNY